MAVQLVDAGRTVAFLGVLDGPFEPPRVTQRQGTDGLLRGPRDAVKAVAVDAIASLGSVRRLVARAIPPEAPANHPLEAAQRAILWHLRSKALTAWTPRACSASGLHISTGQYGAANRARWSELCAGLAHAEVPVVHEDLLRGGALLTVASLLRASVQAHCA